MKIKMKIYHLTRRRIFRRYFFCKNPAYWKYKNFLREEKEMQKFEEIAVVRGIKEGKEAGFLLGFLKFSGVSAVEYVYNDLFDGFNKYIEKSKNKFDAVLYINDSGSRYLSRFEKLGVANIQLNFSGAVELAEMLQYIFSEVYLVEQAEYEWELRPIQANAGEKAEKEENKMFADAHAVFGVLADVYCKNGLADEIGNGKRYSPMEKFNRWLAPGEVDEIKGRIEAWQQALSDLEDAGKLKGFGSEHIYYAKLFCKKEIFCLERIVEEQSCSISDITGKAEALAVKSTMPAAKEIQAELYEWSDVDSLSVVIQHEAVEKYRVDACKSEALFRLGVLYKKQGKSEQAECMFERAFKCNSVNIKAIFSIAMHALQKGRYDEAETWLKNMLCILQLDMNNNAVCEKNLKLLTPKELAYAKKCYANLYKIACRKNDDNNLYYKTMKEKAEGAFPSS